MAHFAKVENGIVTNVIVVDDQHEANPQEFFDMLGFDGQWVQTSYNTVAGEHLQGGVPLRKNFAGVGFVYDATRDAFYSQQPYPSWVLNEETCLWESSIPYPESGVWVWDEKTVSWVEPEDPAPDYEVE